ncbi:hypothetical protein BZG01_03620 [Labilibaculum manganireducens]|uniref:Uncharacterized protein n=1 Tax=Labilibaculum manganireducens TaxID=1940525 RepID=A0A2N3IER4_9BACT|nr:hypothetical protein BZG01_03620 [Labilibaculum manganireducens]
MHDGEKENGEKINVVKDFRIELRLSYFGRTFRKSGGQSRKDCKGIPDCFTLHPFYFLFIS